MFNGEILGFSNGFKLSTRLKQKTASTIANRIFFSSTGLGAGASELFHDIDCLEISRTMPRYTAHCMIKYGRPDLLITGFAP